MKNKKLYLPKRIEKDMTLIIGARCKDGVVLIADKKVVEGTDITSEEKITKLPLNIYVAGAGVREIIDKFNERIPFILEDRKDLNFEEMKKENPRISRDDVPFYFRPFEFLDDCEGLLNALSQKYIDENHKHWHSSILVGVLVNDTAELHCLDTFDCLDSKRRAYKTIGCGSPYADFMLKKLWKKDLTMKEVAKIGKFIINYIEKSGIDNNVGRGVQIVFMPDVDKEIDLINKDIKKYEEEFKEFDDKELMEELDKAFKLINEKVT